MSLKYFVRRPVISYVLYGTSVFIILSFLPKFVHSQQTLASVIQTGIENSQFGKMFKTQFAISKAEYQITQSSIKPTLGLALNTPSYNRDLYAVVQPDGSIKYVKRIQNTSTANVSLIQPIYPTGGRISILTSLTRNDNYITHENQYNSTPILFRIDQPIFAYNSLKWNKKIAQLKLKEAQLTLDQSFAQFSYEICKVYFDILEAQVNEELAASTLENVDTNLIITKRKLVIGTVTEDNVLQLEIQKILSSQELESAKLEIRSLHLTLNNLTDSRDTLKQRLSLPIALPKMNLNLENLLILARIRLPQFLYNQRLQVEAASRLAQARSEGRSIDLSLSYGLNNARKDFKDVFRNPNINERLSISLSFPIYDWGKRRKTVALAELQEKEANLISISTKNNLETEIRQIFSKMIHAHTNILKSREVDSLASKRYNIATRLYQLGKSTLTDLQLAQNQYSTSKRYLIYLLRQFWENYYLLSVKTGLNME